VYVHINQEPSCGVEEALVSGNNPIPDAQITASSEYSANTLARFARIDNTDGNGGWACASADYSPTPTMYIQVCALVANIVTPFTNIKIKNMLFFFFSLFYFSSSFYFFFFFICFYFVVILL